MIVIYKKYNLHVPYHCYLMTLLTKIEDFFTYALQYYIIIESFAANQENISIPSTLTNSECNEEEIASTTFNGQFLDNQNRTLDCINHRNCAMFKQQQALPQERCTVCRDFYTNKPFLQKTQQQVYDAHIMKPIRKYNENKVTYQELKRPTIKKTIVKQSQNTKVAGCYLDQTILKEQQKVFIYI